MFPVTTIIMFPVFVGVIVPASPIITPTPLVVPVTVDTEVFVAPPVLAVTC